MAGFVPKEDIIDPLLSKILKDLATDVQAITAEFRKLVEESSKLSQSKGLKDIVKDAKDVSDIEERLAKTQKELIKVTEQLSIAYSDEAIALANAKELQKKVNADISESITGKKALVEATKKQAEADKQASQSTKLLITAQNAQKGSAQQLSAVNAILANRMKALNVLTTEGAAKYKQLDAAMQRNKDKITELNRAASQQVSVFKNLAQSIATYAMAYVSVQSVVQVLKSFLDNARKFEQLSFGFKTIIKDNNEIAQTYEFLSKTAQNYGLDLVTISERYMRFRAATLQSNMTAQDTQKIYDSVSKAAAVLGLKTDEVAGVYLALEQMISKGKVTTEELRRQLGERLSGAFGIFASAIGVSTSELDKMLKKGEIISKDVLPKFAVQLQKAYGIEQVSRVETLNAAIQRLTTTWELWVQSTKGGGFLKDMFNSLNTLMTAILNVDLGVKQLIEDWSFGMISMKNSDIKELFQIMSNVPSSSQESKAFQKMFDSLNRRKLDYVIENKNANIQILKDEADFSDKRATALMNEYIRLRKLKVTEDRITANINKINNAENLNQLVRLEKQYIQMTVDELKKGNDKKADEYAKYRKTIRDRIDKLNEPKESEKDPNKKGNQYTPLEKLQDENRQALLLIEKNQNDLLASKNLSDAEIIQADQDNKKELIQIRLWQIEEEKKLVSQNAEETGKLNDEKAKVEMELSKATADFVINERKRLEKDEEDRKRLVSESFMGDTESGINNESIRLTNEATAQILRVKNDKDAADKIRNIELQLSLDILKYRKQEYEAALLSNKLTEEDKKRYKEQIDKISLDISQSGLDIAKQGSKEEVKDKKETLRNIGDAANEAANFGQQIFSNQAEAAKKRYDDETKAAGDNVEAKIIAERKYAEEDLKIRRRQDIADKAQAIFNIGLSLAMATAELNVFQIIAATLALAGILAKPVPQYFKGKVGTPGTFIAGDDPNSKGASELIELQSGESFLTPDRPTLFSDPKFKGATVYPNFHDKTQKMLQNYSVNQGSNVFVDMSKSEKSLDAIAQNTKSKDERGFDAKGRMFVKRGSVLTTL